jgi:outer membrane biogenesis lipoprotein LolB
MNAHKSRKLFAFLVIAVVMLLTACQTAAPAATNMPVQPDQSATATATDLPVEPTSTL